MNFFIIWVFFAWLLIIATVAIIICKEHLHKKLEKAKTELTGFAAKGGESEVTEE